MGTSITYGTGFNGYVLGLGRFSKSTAPSKRKNWEAGGNFSAGPSFTYTTAENMDDTLGFFINRELDLGVIQITWSKGTNAAGKRIKSWTVGPTIGIGYAKYGTDTKKLPIHAEIPAKKPKPPWGGW